ncbi:amidohydrolase family protein [endosymbiont 'TC1' of Trimyema compressum]|uniref:amidohydrolase family protein n=1 Tax=endosymbiont 'TC1' of Trimyema compressum TaxID=243899 RepID=UPI000B4D5247|nr:amidohydrolase family protein [endosymbiont 'TC1' of Trimyema compressum]
MFCSDNLSFNHMKTKGHMDFFITKAVTMGIAPIKAIKISTYYTARHFRTEDKLGVIAPGHYVDIVLTDSLSKIKPKYVFQKGELVVKNRKILRQVQIDYSNMVEKSVMGLDDLKAEDLSDNILEISADGTKVKVYLFDIFGRGHLKFYQEI